MFQQFICQLFSVESQLSSLHLDITFIDHYLYEYLQSSNKPFSYQSCQTLRNLHIRLTYIYFLEYLIEYVPSLEKLCVYFDDSLDIYPRSEIQIRNLIQTNGNWFNKVRQNDYDIIILYYRRIFNPEMTTSKSITYYQPGVHTDPYLKTQN